MGYINPTSHEFMGLQYQSPSNSVEERIVINRIELEKESAKAAISLNRDIQLLDNREKRRQINSEKRKAQYDDITLHSDGTLSVVTRNLEVQAIQRRITNFIYPEVIRLKNKDDTQVFYLFGCKIGKKDVHTYLSAEKAGSPVYVLKKMNAVGCEIYADSKKRCEFYAAKIWSKTLENCHKEIFVADYYGWQILNDGTMDFVKEGTLLWQDVKKGAR